MDSTVQLRGHTPFGFMGVLGCKGYAFSDNIVCLTANGDNNFIDVGIVEGTLLFVNTGRKYKEGELNIFRFKSEHFPQYILSRERVAKASYLGRVIMAMNHYE